MNTQNLLTEPEAIARLAGLGIRRTSHAMRQCRCHGGGPAFYRVGRAVRYPAAEIDRWAASLFSPLMATTRAPVEGAEPLIVAQKS